MSNVDFADEDTPLEAIGLAMAVGFGEIEGGEFDWDTMTWKKRET